MATITWDLSEDSPGSLPQMTVDDNDLRAWALMNAWRFRCHNSGIWVPGPRHLIREPRTGNQVLPEFSNGDRSVPGFGSRER